MLKTTLDVFDGDIVIDGPLWLNIEGGWDSGFSDIVGATEIHGSLTILTGKLDITQGQIIVSN